MKTNMFLTSKENTEVKVQTGMLVALAILTSTSQTLASKQCGPQTPEHEARQVVEELATKAEGLPKGSLNLRFMFDPSASKDEKWMWQSLVVETFFAAHATRINVQLAKRKKDHYWIDGNDVVAISKVLKGALNKGIDIAIYNMPPKAGEYRIAVA